MGVSPSPLFPRLFPLPLLPWFLVLPSAAEHKPWIDPFIEPILIYTVGSGGNPSRAHVPNVVNAMTDAFLSS
ncbi:hypothetical protein P152DRAFT_455319 [Eremomyces bilateralis CBS 781.70]|uniref:Uncharacterized protein n=1 Tax=Eremomyces bilateralis CBS 781.70 TaxID=1392243 RepID=A0A6G1GCF8_9PEZI|nr:uncharacterized protein P152DRAFT_455319 [Eremomyces bilateralis CBS 781.70]KAF1815606.1 hypothetical protein P152DRAFT_455319 [Eremomyces bilateralis CBS 781.70]